MLSGAAKLYDMLCGNIRASIRLPAERQEYDLHPQAGQAGSITSWSASSSLLFIAFSLYCAPEGPRLPYLDCQC
jgi:hypothetical protein